MMIECNPEENDLAVDRRTLLSLRTHSLPQLRTIEPAVMGL